MAQSHSRRPSPREVFNDPAKHITFLCAPTDDQFEGQHFDRKEAGRPGQSRGDVKKELEGTKELVRKTLSAFSNANQEGGVLVLGIATDGQIVGLDHLDEDAHNSLSNPSQLLKNHHIEVKLHQLPDREGVARDVLIYYAGYVDNAICETAGRDARFWLRQGKQSILGDDSARDRIKATKRIVDFERRFCDPFVESAVDAGVLKEYRSECLKQGSFSGNDGELLANLGAVGQDDKGKFFTNAGMLFFGANPERVLPARNIRLIRFDAAIADHERRGLPTFDRTFAGSTTQQLRSLRSFFRESGFFRTFQVRRPEGGFRDVPEFPQIAVDEAIVNAVAHRDYAIAEPIICETYRDAFVVRNPGRLKQRGKDLPESFSLGDMRLESVRNNPMLLTWLQTVRDPEGAAYVQVLSEGTLRMRDEMARASLPPPEYRLGHADTEVRLFNDIARREVEYRQEQVPVADEYANLFAIQIVSEGGAPSDASSIRERRDELFSTLRDSLRGHEWHVDRMAHGRIVAHRRGADYADVPEVVRNHVRFFPAFSFRFRDYGDQLYLCLDYELQIKNVLAVQPLLQYFSAEELGGLRATVKWNGWHSARIKSIDAGLVTVTMDEFENVEKSLGTADVIPNLPMRHIDRLLRRVAPRFDLHKVKKTLSLANQPDASRVRAERTQAAASALADTVFPLQFGANRLQLVTEPKGLARRGSTDTSLALFRLSEPKVLFHGDQQTPDIRDGITRFGSYAHEPTQLELVPICTQESRDRMAALIERLKVGKYKYKGSERTFGARFGYHTVVTATSVQEMVAECGRLLEEHPTWAGDPKRQRLFLIETPEAGFSTDDEGSPYYAMKRRLLEAGIPCQMVDTPTLINPDWKDLNLALNIAAKCGVTPWVLPDAIPDADFFIGLSYTQSERGPGERLMGYANVFNSYGKWEFYSANTEAFGFDQREQHMARLVAATMKRLSLSDAPHIHFHYTKKFSRSERFALLRAARSVRPNGTYSFVWINLDHGLRFYDRRPETDGSIARGSYVVGAPNQIYVSTTGFNPYRKSLGTPLVLEVNVRTEPPEGKPFSRPDLRALAVQILSLTKLNWGSTDSLCAEPITTKYAGAIAYLTAAFLRQGGEFRLHPVLEQTPWFI
jgi:predicted HTH transcriptional regulator